MSPEDSRYLQSHFDVGKACQQLRGDPELLPETWGPETSSAVLKWLVPGNTYVFQVMAFNAAGEGEWSEASMPFLMPERPDGLGMEGDDQEAPAKEEPEADEADSRLKQMKEQVHSIPAMRHRLGGWVALLLTLVLGLFGCFIGPAPALPKRNPLSVARWAETAENDGKSYSSYENHPWVLKCTSKDDSSSLQFAKKLDAQLRHYGRAALDCQGAAAVSKGIRTARQVHDWIRPLLEQLNASLAFYPELLRKEDGPARVSTRIHVRPIHVSNDATAETVLTAPAADDKISGLAVAVKDQFLKNQKARVLGAGAERVNRIIKGQIRANSYLQNSMDGEVKHIWGVGSLFTSEGSKPELGPMTSLAVDFVQGPKP
eukprot:symbB.v1.2.008664.t1/scaffold537.1/size221706/8